MGIRAECDTRGESLGKRVRDAQLEKVGLIVTLGQRELDEQTASVRLPSGDQVNGIPTERFIAQLKAGLDGRLADLVFTTS
jgi:threonyl-tRNA synthetase